MVEFPEGSASSCPFPLEGIALQPRTAARLRRDLRCRRLHGHGTRTHDRTVPRSRSTRSTRIRSSKATSNGPTTTTTTSKSTTSRPGLIESRLIFYGNKALTGFSRHRKSPNLTPTSVQNGSSSATRPAATRRAGYDDHVDPGDHSLSAQANGTAYTAQGGHRPNACQEWRSVRDGRDLPTEARNQRPTRQTASPPKTTVEASRRPEATRHCGPQERQDHAAARDDDEPVRRRGARRLHAKNSSAIHSRRRPRAPRTAGSGTVTLEVPTLPPGSLIGSIYLGKPAAA